MTETCSLIFKIMLSCDCSYLSYSYEGMLPYSKQLFLWGISLQLIGTPSEAEMEFLNENAKRYIRQLPLYRRQSFVENFPHVNPGAIDLVEKMLTFDPRRRITGEEPLTSTSCIIHFCICMLTFSFMHRRYLRVFASMYIYPLVRQIKLLHNDNCGRSPPKSISSYLYTVVGFLPSHNYTWRITIVL